ncbi:tyrosine-type recombinase/integrase [Pseudomonas coronafaciens]|uniref:tyrosine-type recombinase/integrase n=1 Tax=Pseudomonas coronafaciens TaxID=53409 RepID=UPI000F1E13FB|nr:tyrosine-type recombinase/integrase [Pseudomonas coronafaciens]RMV68081.1 Phage integrase [Pseudomonas coronafaciens pv. atropurpurea]
MKNGEGTGKNMVQRKRLTEMEAYAVKSRQSEPVGSRGKGTLLLERKASGAILAFYRERTAATDKRVPLGMLAKKPRPGTDERTLDALRTEAMRIAAEAGAAGSLTRYLELRAEQLASADLQRELLKHKAEEEAKRGTLSDMLEAYVEHLEQSGKASARKVRSLFRVNVTEFRPALANKFANEIQPEEISQLLSAVLERPPKARGIGNKAEAPATNMRSTADELRRYLRTAYNHAAASHLAVGKKGKSAEKLFGISSNPAALIPPIDNAKGGNTESLAPEELAELLIYLDTLPTRKKAIAQALVYLGGQRIKQLLATEWQDVSDTSITLLDAKGKKTEAWEHLLPITPRIQEIISPLISDRIGPGPFALVPEMTAHRDTVSSLFSEASKVLVAAGKTAPFSWQRVRATCETLLAANGISTEVRAWLLSHGRSGVQAKYYDRNAYMPEKTSALLLWGDYLDALMKGESSRDTNVIVLAKRRKAIKA